MTIELVKGFRDVLSPSSLKRQKIKEIIEKNFKLFGFVPIETPIIEYDSLAKGENEVDEAVSERFKLKDRGNRELTLRYEFTFQLKRIFKENPNIKLPFRRYQIGSAFRDEPIGKDRYREFTQCDADIIGDEDINADAECLALGDKICKDLRINYKLKINNKKLLNSILEKLDIKNKQEVFREIDKLDKIGEEEIKKNLSRILTKEQINKLFTILRKKINFFVKEKYEGAEELLKLTALCKDYNIKAEFSPFLVRGFSYYTGLIFEAYTNEIKGSIFAGGRFDNLVGSYINKKIPSVGISFGRILDYQKIQPDLLNCLIISINQEKKAVKLMNNLRKNNISCFIMKKVTKALEYANSYSIQYVLFLGQEEIKKKKIKIRNMKTGKEKFLDFSKLILFFNDRLSRNA